MKKIFIKPIMLVALLAGLFSSCVKEDDFAIPALKIPFYEEKFQDVLPGGEIVDNTTFDLPGWTNFSEKGTLKWKEQIYRGDGYAEFNSYGSGELENVSWLISPTVDISDYTDAKFTFQSAQNFISNDGNKLEVYVSGDFDGTDVLGATWTKMEATVATKETKGYAFIPAGEIDLVAFQSAGKVNIAFKATGSGSNTSLDGLFQVNDLYVYTTK